MGPQHLWHMCTYRQNKHLCRQLNRIMKCLGWSAKPSICTSGTKGTSLAKALRVLPTTGQPATRGSHCITQWRVGPAVPTFIPPNNPASAPALPFCPPHILLRHCCCTGTVILALWRISTTLNTTGAVPYSLQAVPGLISGMWAQHPPSVPNARWIH